MPQAINQHYIFAKKKLCQAGPGHNKTQPAYPKRIVIIFHTVEKHQAS
jgi:hypothetical protein